MKKLKNDPKFAYTCWTVYSLYVLIGFWIFTQIYNAQPASFIDEIFHIPQIQRYCNYQFTEWDDKISTPPGLYIFTLPFVKFISLISFSDACTVYSIRAFNLMISFLIFKVLFDISKLINPTLYNSRDGKYKLLISALNLSIFPVLYFFSFLYYTDCLSTYLMLLSFKFYLQKNEKYASLFCSIATIVRQTNIVWLICYILPYSVLDDFSRKVLAKRDLITDWVKYIKVKMNAYKISLSEIINRSIHCLLPFTIFGIFVIYNKGFAFGDRSAHSLVLHIPQIFYFLLFFAFFAFPYVVSYKRQFGKLDYGFVVMLSLVSLFLLIVHFCTMEHLYLISDNRHYTFYIWKRYLQYPVVQYGLVPVYIILLFCIERTLMFKPYNMCIFHCIFSSLVFHKLLDFRYYIFPYIMIRLHIEPKYWFELIIEFCIYMIVNFVTIYLFLNKPIFWPDGTLQRFIW